MSAYPECEHGHNNPNFECKQCSLLEEIKNLKKELEETKEKMEFYKQLCITNKVFSVVSKQ